MPTLQRSNKVLSLNKNAKSDSSEGPRMSEFLKKSSKKFKFNKKISLKSFKWKAYVRIADTQ